MEYLNFENSGNISKRLADGDLEKYWAEVRRRRASPNGVFGFKIFIGNYKQTLQKCPDLVPSIWADRVIHLTRKDKVAQAVSHSRAVQSSAWFAGVKERAEAVYDYEKILNGYRMAKWQERQWDRLFRLTGVEPLRLTYEDILADPEGLGPRVCAAFGIEMDPAAALPNVEMTKPQANEQSREWCQRFIEELASREDERKSSKKKLAA